jgi:hypothetical protein
MISTRDLSLLPDIDGLKRLSKSLAMLDAIISPEWESRYYSFNSKWNKGEEMASMRDGSGDEYFLLFNSSGAILKGFGHESVMTPYRESPPKLWQGIFDSVPEEFAGFLSEPAFDIESTTFCIWRKYGDEAWQSGNINFPQDEDPDGSEGLLFMLDSNPETYKEWAEYYYEVPVNLSAVKQIYEHRPLSNELLTELNPNISMAELENDMDEIGWPGTLA